MIICRQTNGKTVKVSKISQIFLSWKLFSDVNKASSHYNEWERYWRVMAGRCNDDKHDVDNNFHYSSSAKEEFLIQFVKKKRDGKRRQAELCVRQWKHKDD